MAFLQSRDSYSHKPGETLNRLNIYMLSIFFTFFSSLLCTRPVFVRLRFCLVSFLVRMWLLKACLRFTFPVPVSLNRFFAPDFVLTLGISILFTTIFYFLLFGASITYIRLRSSLGNCSTLPYSSSA